MASSILNLLNSAVTAVGSWFMAIFNATGMEFVYVANFVVVLSVGILLGPILGSARAGLSDVVRRKSSNSSKDDE